MQNASNSMSDKNSLNILQLLKSIWDSKLKIVVFTALIAILSIVYVLNVPNKYRAEVLLAPVSEDSGLKIPGQLGGLAALAGVNLNSGSGSKTVLALEVLKSRDFLSKFIKKYDVLVPIMAAEGWSREDNVLLIDADIYDEKNNVWTRKPKSPYKATPSLMEAYKEFSKILLVQDDPETGMVNISIEYYSPFLAKVWLDRLVEELNDEMRSKDLTEANNSIVYLNDLIERTSVSEMKSMLFSLIEEQTKKVMLANVRKEYVFTTLDPALVPEDKNSPKRALIVFLAVFLSFICAVLVSAFMFILREND